MTDVAYIGGAGRSGSTVLALLLGQVSGFVPVGGVNNLWERGLKWNYLCGCGSHFRDCPFWQEIGQEAFGGWDAVDLGFITGLKAEVARYRHVPAILAPRLRPTLSDRFAEYSAYLAAVYRAIKVVANASVVVDNSHDVPPAVLLRRAPSIRGRVLHLVRDSRGVAYSLSKQVVRAEATTVPAYMPTYSPIQASGIWLLANAPYHAIRGDALPRLRIHYEALVTSPAREIARIVDFFGMTLSPSERSRLEASSIEISENHMISGNPHRLGRTSIELRLDDEWRRKMKPSDRLLVTLLTSPLSLPYGYVGRRLIKPAKSSQTSSA